MIDSPLKKNQIKFPINHKNRNLITYHRLIKIILKSKVIFPKINKKIFNKKIYPHLQGKINPQLQDIIIIPIKIQKMDNRK